MTTPVPTHHHDGLITRRSIFIGAAASLFCAPAIVRAASLMPIKGVILRLWSSYTRGLITKDRDSTFDV